MIANALLLAVLIVLGAVLWVLGETTFLAPYRSVLLDRYGIAIALFLLVLLLNLTGLLYLAMRVLLLKDTGRKLAHLEKQLRSGSPIVQDLAAHLED